MAEIDLYNAAEKLDLHPCELVLEAGSLTAPFEEVYPLITESYFETIKQKYADRIYSDHSQDTGERNSQQAFDIPAISDDGESLICHLFAKRRWGNNRVPEDELNKRCRSISDLDSAISELEKEDLIIVYKKRGRKDYAVSLQPDKKRTIRAIRRRSLR